MPSSQRVAVIGAGPTGLGAAWRLRELGHAEWDLYEASGGPGGLATSVVDDAGFTWDLGGHVLFSHYQYFDRLMDAALGDKWLEHQREAWVWIRDRWVPYPFQNNIWRLPDEDVLACLEGLIAIQGNHRGAPPASFDGWLQASFGEGLCDLFMRPYNEKVWAYHPRKLDVGWMGERVATVDLSTILRNVLKRQDEVSWGPNATFRFPLRGGTGAIWQSVADQLPATHMHYNKRLVAIDPQAHTLGFTDGSSTTYDHLLSTMPLNHLLGALQGEPDLSSRAKDFVYSSSHIVGVGLAGQPPEHLQTKCWMYFPEAAIPFYRCTVFSNYSPNNVARPGHQWSLMAEVSESGDRPVDTASVVDETIAGMRRAQLIDSDAVIESTWHRRLDHGYPTPWLGRDHVLDPVDDRLRQLDIYSRGRFGGWKYEVANQDHSVMQGVEAVDAILSGSEEQTYPNGQ